MSEVNIVSVVITSRILTVVTKWFNSFQEDHDLDPEVVTPERGQNDPGHDRGTEDLGQGQGEDQGILFSFL